MRHVESTLLRQHQRTQSQLAHAKRSVSCSPFARRSDCYSYSIVDRPRPHPTPPHPTTVLAHFSPPANLAPFPLPRSSPTGFSFGFHLTNTRAARTRGSHAPRFCQPPYGAAAHPPLFFPCLVSISLVHTLRAHENPTHIHIHPVLFACVLQSYTNSNEMDVAPESGAIIPAEDSPSGKALLVAAYEGSFTLAVFEISTEGIYD